MFSGWVLVVFLVVSSFSCLLKGIATFIIGAVVVTAIALVSVVTAGTAVPVLVEVFLTDSNARGGTLKF